MLGYIGLVARAVIFAFPPAPPHTSTAKLAPALGVNPLPLPFPCPVTMGPRSPQKPPHPASPFWNRTSILSSATPPQPAVLHPHLCKNGTRVPRSSPPPPQTRPTCTSRVAPPGKQNAGSQAGSVYSLDNRGAAKLNRLNWRAFLPGTLNSNGYVSNLP